MSRRSAPFSLSSRARRQSRMDVLEELETRRLLYGGTLSIVVNPTEIPETPGQRATFVVTRTGDTVPMIGVPLTVSGPGTLYTLNVESPATYGGGYINIPAGMSTARLDLTVTPAATGGGPDYVTAVIGSACDPCCVGTFFSPSPSTATLTLEGTDYTQCDGCPTLGTGVLPPVGDFQTPAAALASDVDVVTGTYFQDHQLITYSSQGQDRGIDLQYSSLQANPMPIVQMTLVARSGPAPITSIYTQLTIDGVSQGPEVAHAATGLSSGQSYTIAAQAGTPALSLATGIYPYTLTFRERFSDGSYSAYDSISSSLDIINRSIYSSPASAYGAGWSIGDLQAIIVSNPATNPLPANSLLVTSGSQGSMDFTTFDGINYSGTASDTSKLVHYPTAPGGYYWARTYPDGTVLRFDANGRETSVVDRNSNTTTYTYVPSGAAAGALATIIDPVGLVTTLTYNSSGKLTTVIDPAGRVTSFTIGSPYGNLGQIVDPDSAVEQYGYAVTSNHLITTEVSPNAKTATVTYDSYGRVQSEALFGGLGTTSVSLAQEQGLSAAVVIPGGASTAPIGSITDPNGKTTTMSFDSMYEPLTSVDATTGSATMTYVRNDRNWVTKATDPDNRSTYYTYDDSGNVTSVTRNDGTSMTVSYGFDSRPKIVTDFNHLTTTYAIDPTNGNVTQRLDPDGNHEDWTYNPAGQVLTDTDRNGHTTTYTYNKYGRLTSITEPSTPASNNVATGGMAADSTASAAAPYAFDQSLATKWAVVSAGPTLTYTFPAGVAQVVTQYALTSGDDNALYPTRAPKDWTFQGFNGSAWITLDTQSGQSDGLNYDTKYYQVAAPGPYTAYRLAISANNGTSITQLQEFQLLATPAAPAAANVATGGAATDSPTLGFAASAFDQSLATKWITSGTAPTLTYTFPTGVAQVVTQYALVSGNDNNVNPGRAPKNWVFQGLDGSAWITLDAQANQSDNLNLDTKAYQVAVPGSYTAYRLAISANNGDASYTQLQELQLLARPTARANVAKGGTAADSPTLIVGAAAYAFDQSLATRWITSGSAPTLTYTLPTGVAQVVTQYALTSGDDNAINGMRAPRNWVFQGYNGSSWITLDAQANQSDNLNLDTKYYQVAVPGSYTAYRLAISANNGDTSYTQLQELLLLANPPRLAYGYDAAGDLTSTVDEVGDRDIYTYDLAGRVLSSQDPVQAAAGKATSYTYDADGNLKTVTDALNHVTSYAYDARDRVVNMTDPANQASGTHPTTYVYDGMNLTTVFDPNGDVTTFAYDGRDRMTGTSDALAHHTTWAYDNAGLLTSLTDANGHATTYTYDLVGRLATVTDPTLATITFSYTNDDQLASVVDPLGHAVTYGYDNLLRLSTITDPLTATTSRTVTYGYDLAGNRTTVTDPLGHVTTSTYDARDRLVGRIAPSGGGTTTYAYDNASRLTGVKDPVGNLTSYRYDAADRVVAEVDPKAATTSYAYDVVGNLKTVVDRNGRTTSYAYDADDRETVEQWTSGTTYSMTVTYDYAGRVTGVVDNYSQYSYGYDYADRLITINEQDPGLPQVTMTYGYDNVGNRTSLADTQGGSVSYTYDARNELTSLVQFNPGSTAERVVMAYDPAGRMTTMTRYYDTAGGPGLVAQTVDTFDSANRLTNQATTNPGGSPISSYAYTIDAADRLIQLARTWTTSGGSVGDTATYGYTSNDQLTSVSHSGTASLAGESFGFDANGNRNTAGYSTAASNQTGTDGTYNYAYDAEGNLISKTPVGGGGVQTLYAWDNRNRLTLVQQVSGGVTTTVAQYTYDAFNRLIKTVEGTTTRATLYDGQTPLLDFNSPGAVTARYLSVPRAVDAVLAKLTSGGVAWYLADRLGSVNDIISNSAGPVDHIEYGAFGNVVAESTPAGGDRFKYAGMEADAVTGLSYDRARWYDPSGGKFIGQDPIGFTGGDANLYRYTGNEPSDLTDPSGLAPPTGGYWGGWVNPANWVRGLYTGDPNASDEVYNGALSGKGGGGEAYTKAYNDQAPAAILILSAGSRAPGPAGYVSTGVSAVYQSVLNPNPIDPSNPQMAVIPPRGPGKPAGSPSTCPTNAPSRPANLSPPNSRRSGAFNQAKRNCGIPTGQQPDRVLPNTDRRGNVQPGRVYEFDVPTPGGGKRTIRIRDDAGGHDFGPGDPQNRGPHFNDEAGGHYDY